MALLLPFLSLGLLSPGDSSQVQEQLRKVQHIQATDYAFAAILESGAIVTWGCSDSGGDCSHVQEQLLGLY